MKKVLKNIIYYIFKIYYKLKFFTYRLLVKEEAASYVLYESLFPLVVLEMFGAKIGENVRVNRWLILHETKNSFKNLIVGNDVHIGKNVFIDLSEPVIIGNRVTISMFSKILTHQTLGDTVLSEIYPSQKRQVFLPDDVFIGINSTLLCTAQIKEKTLVGANTLVKEQYDSSYILAGNPAKIIKSI